MVPSASKTQPELPRSPAYRNTYVDALTWCAINDYQNQVAAKCFEHTAAIGGLSLALYDVTTLHSEAENADELRKISDSKERRVDP